MTEDFYIVAIAALLPLTACMLVFQVNPYHALVIRGIVGAIAALVYTLFGAADVALTEALVGTMLSITLYAVAVRSSMSMRLGILEPKSQESNCPTDALGEGLDPELLSGLRKALSNYHLRLELVEYASLPALQAALMAKEVHSICLVAEQLSNGASYHNGLHTTGDRPTYQIQTRVQRLYEILQGKLEANLANFSYVQPAIGQVSVKKETETPVPVEVK